MLKGISTTAEIAGVTLGPRGRCVIIDKTWCAKDNKGWRDSCKGIRVKR